MPVPSSTGLDRFAVKRKSKGKQSKKCRPFPLNGYLGVFSEKNRDLKNRTLQPRRVARTSVLRSKTLAQGGFIPPCAFPITHGFQKEKTRKACLFFLEVTPRFELGNEGFADPCLTTWLCHRMEKGAKCLLLFHLWSGRRGSNSLPPPWQGGALPDELRPQMVPQARIELATRGFSVRCSTN